MLKTPFTLRRHSAIVVEVFTADGVPLGHFGTQRNGDIERFVDVEVHRTAAGRAEMDRLAEQLQAGR